MLTYKQWLTQKQKTDLDWYRTMIDNKSKSLYKKEYAKYKKRVQDFQKAVQQADIRETARELVALG